MPLPKKIEDWKAPWEKTGEEIDAEKAKALLFSLLQREEKAIADAAAEKKRADEAEQAKNDLQTKLDDKGREGESDAEKRTREQAAAEKRVKDAEEKATKAESRALRLEVASEKGLTAKQAGRLQGTTKEELEADADELLATFGGPKEDDKEEEKEVDRNTIVTAPRRVTANPLDNQQGGSGRGDLPLDKALDLIPRPA